MNYLEKKQTHRHRKQTYGYQRGRGLINYKFDRYTLLGMK